MRFKKEFLIIILIVVLGLFLRFYKLGENPPSLYWDETAIGLDAYSIGKTGRDINDYYWLQPMLGSYGDFKAPVYIWLASLAVKFFGLSAWSVRLPSAIFGTLLIILVYLFSKELFNFDKTNKQDRKWLPIVAAFLVAITPWSLHFSRIGFESKLSVFWVVLSLWFFLKAVKGNQWFFFFSSLAGIVAFYSYFAVRVLFAFLSLPLLTIFFKQIWQKKWLVLFSILIFFLSLIPMFASPYYPVSQNYRLGTKNLIRNFHLVQKSSFYLQRHNSSALSKLAYHRYWFIARDFFANYMSHFSPKFLFFEGEVNLRHNTGFGGVLLLATAPFLLYGLYLSLKKIGRKTNLFIIFLLFAAPIASSITYEVPNASRAIYLFVPLIILTAKGMVNFFTWSKKTWLLASLTIMVLFLNLGFYVHDYLSHYPQRSSKDWIYTYTQTAKFIKQNKDKYNFVYIDPIYWMPQLYVAYEMPEVLQDLRGLKRAQLKDSPTAFGFPDINVWLKEKDSDKLMVEFLHPEAAKNLVVNYRILENFYFLDGQEALYLVAKEE